MRNVKFAKYFLLMACVFTASLAATSADTFFWFQQDENDVSFSDPNGSALVCTQEYPVTSATDDVGKSREKMHLFRFKRTTDYQPSGPNEGIRERGTTVYSEGFEPKNTDGELPVGWEIKRNTLVDGGLNGNNLVTAVSPFWFRGSIDHLFGDDWVVYVRTGEASLGISFFADDFTWAITPEIILPEDDLIELSFWKWFYNADTIITHFHLNIFSDDAWTTLESWMGEPNNLFDSLILVNLSAYAGKTIRLGFVYEYTDGYEMAVDDILITADSDDFITWTGNLSTDWNLAGNWNNGVPSATDDVVIPGGLTNYPIITGNDICNNLTISENASVVIATAGKLTVNGVLSNMAGTSGLTLKSDELNADASLIHYSTGVEATVERYINGASYAWHQLSSPVEQQQIVPDFHEAADRLFAWHEPAQVWVSVSSTVVWPTWNDANPGDDFIPGKGYLVGYPHNFEKSNPTKVFEGVLNQGEVSVGISRQAHPDDAFTGFNLVGNPYPSAIDWDAVSGWGRSGLEYDNGYTYWLWNDAIGNYGVYINGGPGTNGATQYIAPMQGFWVRAEETGLLTMNDSVRVHASQTWLKNDPAGMLRLSVTGTANNYKDEAAIKFDPDHTGGGVTKLLSLYPNAPNIYFPREGKNYSISLLNSPESEQIVSVNFKAGTTGLHTLKLSADKTHGQVILEDIKEGVFHDFGVFGDYVFSATTSDDENRFLLHFMLLGIEAVHDMNFQFSYNSGSLFFHNPFNSKSQLAIYDISGRIIKHHEISSKGMHQIDITLSPGIYLVRIAEANTNITGKLVVY
ncbi:MAG: T9SS type A sorting domain-containing protein [Bacteroidales bacterium]|nr:T9SS type A sorting domain-containing protein [Bacteroidales bacterium]